jgi:hypothetical protein
LFFLLLCLAVFYLPPPLFFFFIFCAGNISTSHVSSVPSGIKFEIIPRFPLLGGWKTVFYTGMRSLRLATYALLIHVRATLPRSSFSISSSTQVAIRHEIDVSVVADGRAGYNLPLEQSLGSSPDDPSLYTFLTPFASNIPDAVVDELEIRVILPEGARCVLASCLPRFCA